MRLYAITEALDVPDVIVSFLREHGGHLSLVKLECVCGAEATERQATLAAGREAVVREMKP